MLRRIESVDSPFLTLSDLNGGDTFIRHKPYNGKPDTRLYLVCKPTQHPTAQMTQAIHAVFNRGYKICLCFETSELFTIPQTEKVFKVDIEYRQVPVSVSFVTAGCMSGRMTSKSMTWTDEHTAP